MLQQAADFRDESVALHDLLEPLDDAGLARTTQFKQWRIDDILAHLHLFNETAMLSLQDPDAFAASAADMQRRRQAGASLREATTAVLNGLGGRALRAAWRAGYERTAACFAEADPKARVPWYGPEMSVLSSITARLMETWSHAQAIYDLLGVERVDTDRVRNIAVLGVNTFGWTFANRGEPVPEQRPHLRLTAPSGAVWTWHDPSDAECIEGLASEFCQVVAQTRNIADTGLRVRGPVAKRWMAQAQCFAGPPQDPPAPGSRYRAK